MHWNSRLGHVLELYAEILDETGSADGVVQQFFRNRRYLGSRDRRWIGDATWALVRGRVRWRHFAWKMEASTPLWDGLAVAWRDLAVAWFAPGGFPEAAPDPSDTEPVDLLTALPEHARLHELPEETCQAITQWMSQVPTVFESFLASDGVKDPEWRLGWPRELIAHLETLAPAFLGDSGDSVDEWVSSQAQAMSGVVPMGLRVNTSKIGRQACAEALAEEDVPTIASSLSPVGLLVERRVNLNVLPTFKAGLFEVQDEGSQLVAPVIAAEKPTRVLDICAGAGGKSLHLAALLGEKTEIYAADRDRSRLLKLRHRAQRAGASNICTLSLDTSETMDPVDAVLIDAPCSGLGTLRRNPDRIWKVKAGATESYQRRQLKLLNRWEPFVRAGGLLVYVTCSFLPQENEDVITTFLEKHESFTVEDPLPAWKGQFGGRFAKVLSEGWLGHGRQLLPGVHGCDGFFISCLRKKSA